MKKNLKTMSVAVIGCGHWGKNLVAKFHQLGSLAAICDPSEAVQAKMMEAYGVPARSFEQILADAAIDAVVIAAPAEKHYVSS